MTKIKHGINHHTSLKVPHAQLISFHKLVFNSLFHTKKRKKKVNSKHYKKQMKSKTQLVDNFVSNNFFLIN